MESLRLFLRDRLKDMTSLAVLGVGSQLRADDGAGMALVEKLAEAFPREKYPSLLLCPGETAPENYSGKIRTFAPSHLLIVDAADLGKDPGMFVDIDPRDVGGPTYCSHMLPIKVMVDYVVDGTDIDTTLLGVQYKSIAFDGEMSGEVQSTVDAIFEVLKGLISQKLQKG